MNTQITTYTASQISELKFSEQSTVYNTFANELGIKQVKKFRDKSTGVSRIEQIQEQYIEERDEILAKQNKVKKPTVNKDLIISIKGMEYTPKQGSINEFILDLIREDAMDYEDIITEITGKFTRPTGASVNRSFARSSINWLVSKEYIVEL